MGWPKEGERGMALVNYIAGNPPRETKKRLRGTFTIVKEYYNDSDPFGFEEWPQVHADSGGIFCWWNQVEEWEPLVHENKDSHNKND